MGLGLESVRKFFLDPNKGAPTYARCERFMKDTEAYDKLLKIADPAFETLKVIAEKCKASPETIKGIEGGRKAAKITRDVAGMVAIFSGGIRNIGVTCIMMGDSVKGLSSKNPTLLKHTQTPKFHELAYGTKEKLLALVGQVTKLIGELLFVVAFGACRTAGNLTKYCNVKSETAKNLGNAFSDLMLANHVAGFCNNFVELIRLKFACDRALQQNPNEAHKTLAENEDRSWKLATGLVLKFMEVTYGTLKKLHTSKIIPALPNWFHLPMGLGIGVLSIYSVWQRTA